jgi:arylsulfatase A-like enzyme
LAIHNPVQVRGDPVRRSEEAGWERWKPTSEQERIEKYRGITLPIDEGLGQIRESLETLGIDHRTLVLFFSDNGASRDFPSGNPNLRGSKGSVYEGGHKVPFIAWWPGRIAPGSESDFPAMTLDVMPTLLSLAGIESPTSERPPDGVDLSPLLLGGKAPPPRPLFWASLGNNGARAEAMREGGWKLVVLHPKATPGSFENERVELYDLSRDPSETRDLSVIETVRTNEMLKQLKAWYAEMQRGATPQVGGWKR